MMRWRIFQLGNLKIFLFCGFGLWICGLFIWLNGPSSVFQKEQIEGLPFGFFGVPNGPVLTQDFSYNRLYFEGIRAHRIPRPYRLQDQEDWMRKIAPRVPSGMSHAYSPVALVLAWPLLGLSGAEAYRDDFLFSAAAFLLLLFFCLLPRVEHPLQLMALAVCALSVNLSLAFTQAQSALITTAFLGGFWALLRARQRQTSWLKDFFLALLFWGICLKPSVAIIPFVLLLGTRAWRPMILGSTLLGVTWLCLGNLYGGWWTGLRDYLYLLNHYNNADFTPFMRRNYVPGHDAEIRSLFVFDRAAILILSLALVPLRWRKHITDSQMFQGLIGIFLIFSPYLMLSEDLLLCLLLVEGFFFHPSNLVADYAKLLLLFGIIDLRVGIVIPWSVNFPLLCLLFGWMLTDALRKEITWGRLEEA